MDKEPYKTSLRRVSIFLLLSVFINCSLGFFIAALYFYSPFRPAVTQLAIIEKRPSTLSLSSSLAPVVTAMKGLSLTELMRKIDDFRMVESGISVREIALSLMNDLYYFDLEKAAMRKFERKSFRFSENIEPLLLLVDISDGDIDKIHDFIKKEKWPFTAEGLYRLLKKPRFRESSSLQEAFFHTDEFQKAQSLFSRGSAPVNNSELLELLLGAPWGQIRALTTSPNGVIDLSDTMRREFLLAQVQRSSPLAAALLLRGDFEFAVRKLNDKMAIALLTIAPDEEKKQYAQALAKMPRAKDVAKSASLAAPPDSAKKALALVPPPIAPSKKVAMAEKASAPPPLKKGTPSSVCVLPKKVPKKLYVVCDNDSLWKIAKRFSVTMDALRRENRLQTDTLQPGTTLYIPSK